MEKGIVKHKKKKKVIRRVRPQNSTKKINNEMSDEYFDDEYISEDNEISEDLGIEDSEADNEYVEKNTQPEAFKEIFYEEDEEADPDAADTTVYEQNDEYYYEDGDYAEDTGSYYEEDEDYYYDEQPEYDASKEYFDEYEDEYYYDDEYYENEDFFETDCDDYTDEETTVTKAAKKSGKRNTGFDIDRIAEVIKDTVSNMTAFDFVLGATGIVLVVGLIVALNMYTSTKRIQDSIEALAPLGTELSAIGIVGEDGLNSMADAALMGIWNQETQETQTVIETESAPVSESCKVSVDFVSIEKDLKIRFTDANTGELIKGTVFEVELTNKKSGKKIVLKDDDADGVIYATNVTAGKFDAIIKSTDKYKFPQTAQVVTVKDKVEYVVINIQDEIKSESQVNVAKEDTQQKEAAKEEEKLTDTVEWVESTKTLIEGSEGYLITDKTTIPDPSLTTKAYSRMLFDGLNVSLDSSEISMTEGGSAQLKGTEFHDSKDGDVEYVYTTSWKSSDEGVVTVDNGKLKAKSEGKATITYTVNKKTVTKTQDTETVEISVEEYDALSDEEKEKCTIITDDDGQITGYKYNKVNGTHIDETNEEASATCEVTVKKAGASSGTLEISRSSETCSIGGTVTVKPEKLVYTNGDGSTDTITDNFPKISWSSSDESIATVDENGVVTGVKKGTVDIVAKIKGIIGDNGEELKIKATTQIKVTSDTKLSLKLDKTSDVKVEVGKTVTITATVSNYSSDAGVTWESSDNKVATVDENGVVTGVSVGSVKIIAKTNEKDAEGNAVKAECVITVTANASYDENTKLKDKNGNQIYLKNDDGTYKEAVYADYFTAQEFYLKTEGKYAYTGWQTINGKTYYYDKNGVAVTGTQIIKGVTYNFDSEGAIATSVNGHKFGIDVSRHNGNIDWNAVKASGVDYVIIRCGYRGSATGALIPDQNFYTNIKGATAAGLKVGVYVFSQAINEVEAVKEASLAVSMVKGYNLTYPIFIDTESSGGRADGINKATRTAVVNAFCQTVASAGYRPGIYASKTWFEDKLNMSSVGNYKIWLAQYCAAPTYKGKYDMWQYSSKGTISGISGKVDLNLSYMGY